MKCREKCKSEQLICFWQFLRRWQPWMLHWKRMRLPMNLLKWWRRLPAALVIIRKTLGIILNSQVFFFCAYGRLGGILCLPWKGGFQLCPLARTDVGGSVSVCTGKDRTPLWCPGQLHSAQAIPLKEGSSMLTVFSWALRWQRICGWHLKTRIIRGGKDEERKWTIRKQN